MAFQDFEPYWEKAELGDALKRGQAFKCELRINAGDRKSAFAQFEGLPSDIQIPVSGPSNFPYETRESHDMISCSTLLL